MRYVITDGNKYLRQDGAGNYIPVKSFDLADLYEQRQKAVNVLNNCINKNMRKRYRVKELPDTPAKTATDNGVIPKVNVDETIKFDTELVKKISYESDLAESKLGKWEHDVDVLESFAQSTEDRIAELSELLRQVDLEIEDIIHYIELCKFNAYQGWIAANMLKNRRIRRREIKDELVILQDLKDCKLNPKMFNNIKKGIKGLSSRSYQPRVLTELFK